MKKQVEIFKNKADANLFRSTNAIWNKERMNSPWLWGYVSKLAGHDFDSKEEWVEFYYKSGAERLEKIKKLDKEYQDMLLSFNTSPPAGLPDELKKLNYDYGRTKEELLSQTRAMYGYIPSSICFEDWVDMVMYRLLGETWNGIAREKNTIYELYKSLPGQTLSFKKASAQDDYKYAVDFELYNEDKLICGIQVKPPSYNKGNAPYLEKARKANRIKNLKYKDAKGVEVLYVYSENNGEIVNDTIIISLLSMCEPSTDALN